MNKTTPRAFRRILLFAVSALLAVCFLATLAACDDPKGNDPQGSLENGFAINLDNVDSAELNKLLYGALAYHLGHRSAEASEDPANDFNYDCLNFLWKQYNYYENGDHIEAELILEDMYGYDSVKDKELSKVCIVTFLESAEAATRYKAEVRSEIEETFYRYDLTMTQKGSILIFQNEEGLYDSILNSTLNADLISSEQLNFIVTAMNNEVRSDSRRFAEFSYTMGYVGLKSISDPGNISRFYESCAADSDVLFFDQTIEQYIADFESVREDVNFTDTSYVRNRNGELFAYYEIAPGFSYTRAEDHDGYSISGYYYTNDATSLSVVFPSTYKGEPVTEVYFHDIVGRPYSDIIVTATIPASVKSLGNPYFTVYLQSITYLGTKAQWQEVDEYFDVKCVVHCTDGDIYPRQQ